MQRFLQRIAAFMYGRNGIDKLGIAMFVLYCALSFIAIFIYKPILAYILLAVRVALFVLIIFRIFSRNIYIRQKENNKFLKAFGGFERRIKMLCRRIGDLGSKRYRTCPKCKSVARLPIRRGHHTVRCPACKNEFKVHIII